MPSKKSKTASTISEAASRICNDPPPTKQSANDSIQSPGLILPLGLVALQIAALKQVWGDEYRQMDNAFALTSWVWPAVTSVVYVGLIYVGQRMMRDREPLDDFCKPYMLVYNLYQTVFNTWWAVMVCREVYNLGYPIFRLPLTLSSEQFDLGFLIWLHYQNKYLEMLDTTFMVLRKKTRQISFLHCYHHLLLLWAWYFVCKFGCGGESYFGALMNSIIHVLMYGYYFLSMIKVPFPWKRYLTSLQMLQFVICLSHTVWGMASGLYPWRLCLIEVWVMTNMLYLFNEFYKQNYAAKKAKAEAAKKAAAKKKKKNATAAAMSASSS
eukprot:CAMPEP_0197540894 /NCGR_PEP_ID=MMETSP1318-20131121/66857_1 /TAXON_ID=552666 /ORGANISM="Partenskyella glossopodia, Strain RCC365" /LENGTH=324 /DNA_ID=CAMNT_0043100007 /DNA_START=266 /DNA_END=1240 /DNA_ORIENTATION=-